MNPEGTISKENYERIVQDDDYYEEYDDDEDSDKIEDNACK